MSAVSIEEVLARRSDLSTFLVHLTRGDGEASALEKLKLIVNEQTLRAKTPMGMAVGPLQDAGRSTDSQMCVSFTETPLEHASLLAQEIENRECQFEPYGVAITKKQGRAKGVNPVWYLDMTPGHDWLTVPLKNVVQRALEEDTGGFRLVVGGRSGRAEPPILQLTPFTECMGTWPDGRRKEFWWEREWRYCGNLLLPQRYLVLCPEAEHAELQAAIEPWEQFVSIVDLGWSLEQIIARLAGIGEDEARPL